MRDVMDSMEQLASMTAYCRLPEDMEILEIGAEPEIEVNGTVTAIRAEIIQIDHFRVIAQRQRPHDIPPAEIGYTGKNNRIRML